MSKIAFVGAIAASVYLGIRVGQKIHNMQQDKDAHDNIELVLNLHSELDELAENCIDDDADLAEAPGVPINADGWDDRVREVEPVPRIVDGMWRVDRSLTDIKNYRKINPNMFDCYVNNVLCHIRCELGRMERTEANVRVVRRLANKFMENHGVRETHRARVLPLVEQMAFMDSTIDINVRRDVRRFHRWRMSLLKYLWVGVGGG